MGVKLSKPRIRRRCASKASCKRESPEGEPSAPTGTFPSKRKESPCTTNGQLCPCSSPNYYWNGEKNSSQQSDDISPLKMSDERKGLSSTFSIERLQVELPSDQSANFQSAESPVHNESEWVFVLDENANDQSHSERLSRLMTSIRHLVDNEIEQCNQDRKQQIRVRLSLTPEPRSRHDVNTKKYTTAEEYERSCGNNGSNSPLHPNSRGANTGSNQSKTEVTALQENPWKENIDRREHYRDIPGGEEDTASGAKQATQCGTTCKKRRKASASRSRSRDRPCPGAGCCRRHPRQCASSECRSRHHRYQSPFDQSFQEAMCLRLTELQRKSARHARRTRGETVPASEESESDRAELARGSDSNSEYSGDDDNCILTHEPEMQGSRLYEPLSNCKLEINFERSEQKEGPSDYQPQSNNHATTTSVQHHYYDEKGKYVMKETKRSENYSVTSLVKPWHKPDPSSHSGKRKTLKKKRSSGSYKSNHGYLRANAIVHGAVGNLPITPSVTPKTDFCSSAKSPVVVKRHRHEHIHHHYYHHCKPET